jgi:hypothetical protein
MKVPKPGNASQLSFSAPRYCRHGIAYCNPLVTS